MALPTGSQLNTLSFAFQGAPFVTFAKSDPDGLAVAFEGGPLWMQGFSGAGAVGTSSTLRWDLDGSAGGGANTTRGFFMLM